MSKTLNVAANRFRPCHVAVNESTEIPQRHSGSLRDPSFTAVAVNVEREKNAGIQASLIPAFFSLTSLCGS